MNAGAYDIVIIGGGIVGLATALKLKEASPDRTVAVVEKEKGIARHQTGHNSGVIHAGVYYRPGSRKAHNCRRGRRLLIDFCDREGVPYELCGKLIVATRKRELPMLDQLYDRAMENGLIGACKIPGEKIREHEPHAAGLAGIHVPETGIVDFRAVAARYAEIFTERWGGRIFLAANVLGLRENARGVVVETSRGALRAHLVINTAGLYSDKLAGHIFPRLDTRIIPFRGEYAVLRENRRSLVKNLIYPVPDPNFPFLGVHFTRMIDGGVEAGPNAVLAFRREGYRKSSFHLNEFRETIAWPGFHNVMRRYWRMGLGEYGRSFSKAALVKSLQRLVPEIQKDDLVPGGAGVRAQACHRDGGLVDDFWIVESRRTLHVLNAPSPAATASLAIGEHLARRSIERLHQV
jgi:L-2-hydroxyglutarate oxidase